MEPTRDEARRLVEGTGGKADHFGDICAYWGWYEDDVCDEFCPEPDPDCSGSCRADSDCTQVQCLVAPCPESVCVAGECILDNPTDSCDPGMRECDVCGDVSCVPHGDRCITTAVLCPPPSRCDVGERECQTCGDGFVCTPEGSSCPLVRCPPPSRCDVGEHECQTCGDNFVCTPDGVSCPLVQCPPPSVCGEGEKECDACGNITCIPEGDMCITTAVLCPPPSRCNVGERECQTCGDGFVCTPEGASCPLVQCRDTVCEETCRYSGDGECDDGGAGSDYSLCDLGTDCMDCGAR